MWLARLLIQSGDVQPNPGPVSASSAFLSTDSSFSSSFCILDFASLSCHLSFVQYNVQSVLTKLNILYTELHDFDIFAFSETWLNPAISNDKLILQSFKQPERKDRTCDSHGGVMLDIKEIMHHIRRHDLEPTGVECFWVELSLKHKYLLFRLFYRPPNSVYFTSIEDSIHLAIDYHVYRTTIPCTVVVTLMLDHTDSFRHTVWRILLSGRGTKQADWFRSNPIKYVICCMY